MTLNYVRAGSGAPLVLIHGLGTERFGVLTIGWVIMGYFSMFDFGMGLATTRFVAATLERALTRYR